MAVGSAVAVAVKIVAVASVGAIAFVGSFFGGKRCNNPHHHHHVGENHNLGSYNLGNNPNSPHNK